MHKQVTCDHLGRGGGEGGNIILTDHIPVLHNKPVFLIIYICRCGLLYQFCAFGLQVALKQDSEKVGGKNRNFLIYALRLNNRLNNISYSIYIPRSLLLPVKNAVSNRDKRMSKRACALCFKRRS